MNTILRTMLIEALSAHGVPCQMEEDKVVLPDGVLTFQARAAVRSTHDDGLLVELNIGAEAPLLQGRIIWTRFAGFGTDEKAAIGQGFQRFLSGHFHVLLAVFAGHICKQGNEAWLTLPGSVRWDVCESPLMTMGIADPGAVPISPIVDRLMASFVAAAEPGVFHWGELYFAFLNGERNAREAWLDGAPWPEAADVLTRWTWTPPDGGHVQGRYFFLAQPKTHPSVGR